MRYLIDFTKDSTTEQIESYLAENSCELIKTYSSFDKVYLVETLTLPPSGSIVDSIINDEEHVIKLLNVVDIVPPNFPEVVISSTDKKDWWKNYVLQQVDFNTPTNTFDLRGEHSTVYVMDSGVQLGHPEFKDADISPLFSFTGEFGDTRGHGTALASIIAGATCGITSARVKVVKILDDSKPTHQSDLLGALDAILQDFLLTPQAPCVINCSWSITKNEYIENKIRELINVGLYVVASAGNSGVPIADVTPASMPEVLTIGSFSEDLSPSDFSNYTDPSILSFSHGETNSGELDGWAPGENIYVAALDGEYGFASGTSLAAAIHSAVLAYNMSFGTDEAGNLIINRQKQDLLYQLNTSLSRKNLLTLSDPKYATSENRVTTLFNKYEPVMYPDVDVNIGVLVGKVWTAIVFDPKVTQSFEVRDTLLDQVTIHSNGELVIAPTSVIGNYQIQETTLTITNLDGSTFVRNLKIAIVNPQFDHMNVPEDDPITDVIVAIAECCTETPCIQSGSICKFSTGCYGSYSCVNVGNAKSIDCQC